MSCIDVRRNWKTLSSRGQKVKKLILVEMKVLSFKTREKVDYLWYGGGGGRSFGGLSFFFPVSFFQNPL